MTKRINIYLNGPLEKLSEVVKKEKNTGGFSRRLGEIVNEFDIIIRLTELPDFSPEEIESIGELLLGCEVTASKVLGMHLDALDIGQPMLSKKIATLSPAQRIKLIELVYSMCK